MNLKEQLNKFISESISARIISTLMKNKSLVEKINNHIQLDLTLSAKCWLIINDKTEIPLCPVCSTPLKYRCSLNKGFQEFCSIKCMSNGTRIKTKNTIKEKYGVESCTQLKETQDKIKKTNLEKYGVEHSTQRQDVKDKTKDTMIEKYGGYTLQSEQLKEKVKDTLIEKYGVDHCMQLEETKEKIKITNLKKFGVECVLQRKDIREKRYLAATNKSYEFRLKLAEKFNLKQLFSKEDYFSKDVEELNWLCLKCDRQLTLKKYVCQKIPTCSCVRHENFKSSKLEREIQDWLKQYVKENEIIFNDRKICKGKELDIYIPSKNFAIEFNGLYWHSAKRGKDKNYRLNKTNFCKDQGINLFHIFEDEWKFKEEIIKSIILNKLNIHERTIYARKCIVKPIDYNTLEEFLNTNHLQGTAKTKINLGLFCEDELVGVMSFNKTRFKKTENDFELVRFCTKLNYRVIGGCGKLFTYFRKNYQFEKIVSYRQIRFGAISKLYEKIGFKLSHITSPGFSYTDNIIRENRMKFQKHKLKNLLENFDGNLTEYENMQLNGYDKIFDCGNELWEYDKII